MDGEKGERVVCEGGGGKEEGGGGKEEVGGGRRREGGGGGREWRSAVTR